MKATSAQDISNREIVAEYLRELAILVEAGRVNAFCFTWPGNNEIYRELDPWPLEDDEANAS